MKDEESARISTGEVEQGEEENTQPRGVGEKARVPRARPKKEVGGVLWSKKHNKTKTSEYRIWRNMRYRCKNPNARQYSDYGGRGITVCARWDDFELFLQDMGPRPSLKHSIDRINNDGNYEPSNVRWATMLVQNNNNRQALNINGLSASAIARIVGVTPECILKRIKKGHDLFAPTKHPWQKSS